jgi:2-keto-3-deoxy-L-rhamnonate aldolase RhmA
MKERLAAGETLFGTFLSLGSPLAAEALAWPASTGCSSTSSTAAGTSPSCFGQVLGARSAASKRCGRVESAERSRTARVLTSASRA